LLQILESEYGTRYLEGLGVAPSRATLDLVHKNVPLSQKCVNTTLRAKGEDFLTGNHVLWRVLAARLCFQ